MDQQRPVTDGGGEGDPLTRRARALRSVRARYHRAKDPFDTWRDGVRARPHQRRAYRVAVGIIGGAIVAIGIGAIPLPGPGWLIVFFGLAVLASEFEWAARLEEFARRHVKAWTEWVLRQPIAVRAAIALVTAAFAGVVVYGTALIYGVPGWVPVPWVDWLPGLP